MIFHGKPSLGIPPPEVKFQNMLFLTLTFEPMTMKMSWTW